jgi:DNA-directed RNA polymerase III subunit RPC3
LLKYYQTNLVLSVNYEKCNVALRTVQFTRWAARHVGHTTSKVYEAALAVLESKILRCYDPLSPKKTADQKGGTGSLEYIYDYDDLSPPFTAREVSALLDKTVNLQQSLPSDELNGHTDGPVATNGHSSADAQLNLSERAAIIEQHLAILCADQREFVVRESEANSWRIPFQSLTQKLIQAEIENTITARLGKLPAGVARILNANGVLDVKQIAQAAIVKADQVQMAITPLLSAGYIGAQELPRDNSRTVERSIWAYTFNAVHARERLLDDTFKSSARLLQRLSHERARRQTVLQKAARTDVAQNELKYLTANERATLHRCRQLEEFIDRYIIRLDELVAVIRDFSPMVPAQMEFDQVRGHKHLNL